MTDNITDDQLSQFLAFTGSADPNVARQYLEMSGNQLEMAVSLFMDHNNNGGGAGIASAAGGGGMGPSGGGGLGPMGSPNVRAPDATRSMRLVGGPPSPGGGNNNNDAAAAAALMAAVGGPNAAQQMMMMGMMGGGGGGFAAAAGGGIGNDPMEDVMANTWASRDLRETVNQAAARGNRRNRSASGGGGAMSHHDGANNNNNVNNSSRRRRTGSRSHSSSSAAARNNNNDNSNNNNNDSDDDEVQVVDQDGNIVGEVMEESDEDSYHYNDDDDSDDDSMGAGANDPPIQPNRQHNPPSLSTMFQPPNHLIHRAGGFLGAKNFAKDARRWLLVNIQTEDDFACHALNRDVWHDELVENLVREGFVFWQIASTSPEGMTYCQRYKVEGYPHIAIIDPRTGSLLYRKEGWTQVNPLTSEQFVEIASDFCSRHSFDKLPMPARHGYAAGGSGGGGFGMGGGGGIGESRPAKRPVHELSEQEQLEAAIRASMQDASGEQQSDDDEVQVLEDNDTGVIGKSIEDETSTKSTGQENDNDNEEDKQEESKLSPFTTEILSMTVPTEPTATTTSGQANIAKVQLRMPNGKRLVRKFNGDLPVKVIYAFYAQLDDECMEDAKAGRAFELKAKFPPVDLMPFVEDSISSFGLSGEAITFLWK